MHIMHCTNSIELSASTISNYWPLIMTLFYLLSPIPTLLARKYQDDIGGSSNNCKELALFITAGIVIR